MNPSRRSFLRAAVVLAPAVILTPGLLMRIKPREIIDDNVLNATEISTWMCERRIAESMAVSLHTMLTVPRAATLGGLMDALRRADETRLLLGPPYPFKLKLRAKD